LGQDWIVVDVDVVVDVVVDVDVVVVDDEVLLHFLVKWALVLLNLSI
jgi:hypothetical protein